MLPKVSCTLQEKQKALIYSIRSFLTRAKFRATNAMLRCWSAYQIPKDLTQEHVPLLSA